LRDAFYELRDLGKGRKIVLLTPELVVPADLEKELRIQEYRLPTKDELTVTVRGMARRAQAIKQKDATFRFEVEPTDGFINALVDAAVGLTQLEVEYVLENMLYVERRLASDAPRRMVREKQQIIRKSQVLEFIPAEDLEGIEVGGLGTMLRWLQLRKHVFENRQKARDEYGIKEVPRGVLLAGISGCGKSLVCKKIAHEWGCPLLRLDVGAIFDKWVGSSEDRIRNALRVAESVAPCILWVDEIEKGFSSGMGGDGGTSSRVLGTFLVWMQEKKSPVFIAATANDITALPAELLRSGRFDNRFFVGCPGERSRREIFTIHLRAHKLDPASFQLQTLVQMTFGFTGAEIEQTVVDSTFDAFYENRRATMEDLIRNTQRCHPIVRSLRPQMEKVLDMLDNGRMELASDDTVPMKQLVERLDIKMKS
jgi:SpoVK/Ycf46/Vps4 family AAA+-type ATPase